MQPLAHKPRDRKPFHKAALWGVAYTVIFSLMVGCLIFTGYALITMPCDLSTMWHRGILNQMPILPLPGYAVTKSFDGPHSATAASWYEGIYVADVPPKDVLSFYQNLDPSCFEVTNGEFHLGGFELKLNSSYWRCWRVPAKPWEIGSVDILPQGEYINALKDVYNNPPPLLGGITINETIVGAELRLFYGNLPPSREDWPLEGTIILTEIRWCEPF